MQLDLHDELVKISQKGTDNAHAAPCRSETRSGGPRECRKARCYIHESHGAGGIPVLSLSTDEG